MPVNEKIAAQLRMAFAHLPRVEEKKMFSGVTFMIDDKMCISVSANRIMCRIDPLLHDDLVLQTKCKTVMMKNKEYKGYVFVDITTLKNKKALDYWVELALDFNKRAKSSKKKKK